jgi:mannose-6-phosphate isomerase-like protein (cupin superfamily)
VSTRRVVTGRSPDGRPVIVSDGPAIRSHPHVSIPGMVNTLVWKTGNPPRGRAQDPTVALASYVPGVGEAVALVVTFPPQAVFADPGFDPVAAAAEDRVSTPGLADLFDPREPGMHSTPSVDYGVVLDGEIVLDLGSETTTLRAGDVVVQNGTRHAWRNPTDRPSTLFFVLIGADLSDEMSTTGAIQ